jgi:uncharacterized protein
LRSNNLKLLVISDTHGHIERALRLLPLFTDLDAIIHLGDYLRDAEQLQRYTEVKVLAVGGNCDGVTSKVEAIKIIKSPFGPLLITHGHLHGAKKGIDRLLYQAAESNAKAVLFGHTHTPFYGIFGDVSLINPGSLSLPGNQSQGTYAVLNIDEAGISCSLVNYQDPPTPAPPDKLPGKEPPQDKPREKKQTGGFLRDILNNSDRF